jgi:hypothetical protein
MFVARGARAIGLPTVSPRSNDVDAAGDPYHRLRAITGLADLADDPPILAHPICR